MILEYLRSSLVKIFENLFIVDLEERTEGAPVTIIEPGAMTKEKVKINVKDRLEDNVLDLSLSGIVCRIFLAPTDFQFWFLSLQRLSTFQ